MHLFPYHHDPSVGNGTVYIYFFDYTYNNTNNARTLTSMYTRLQTLSL